MKGRLLILGLVFILGALVLNACAPTGAGVSVSPTLMPTAAPADIPPTEQPAEIEESDWITYSNERYGYSFQYPADCFFGRMPVTCKENPPEDRPPECLCFLDGENPDQVFMQAFLGEKENLTLAQFRVSHFGSPQFNPPPGTDLTQWLGEILVGMDSDLPDEPNLSIDGIPAVKIYNPGSPQAPSFDEIYFIREGKLFQVQMLDVDNQENSELPVISVPAEDSEREHTLAVIDEMLESEATINDATSFIDDHMPCLSIRFNNGQQIDWFWLDIGGLIPRLMLSNDNSKMILKQLRDIASEQ